MKKLILSFVITIATLATSFAGTNPVKVVKAVNVFKTAEVEFYATADAKANFYTYADFNTATNNVEFVVKDKIKFLQIFNQDGKLQYQLPVMSNKLKISRKIFETGVYKIGFIVDGGNNIEFSNLKFNWSKSIPNIKKDCDLSRSFFLHAKKGFKKLRFYGYTVAQCYTLEYSFSNW